MRIRHSIGIGLLATSAMIAPLAAAAAKAPTPSAKAGAAAEPTIPFALPYHQFTLANGLTVIVYTDHSVPDVFVGVWYKVGAKNERAGRTGFAHLFEHLMFEQTRNRKGDFVTPLDSAGASDVNGMTTSDYTEFHETVPTGALDLALWMESDRMAWLGAGITQTELDEQRAIVKNEKRQGDLRPGVTAHQHFLDAFYPRGHPYAHDPIGSMKDIDAASLVDVKQWFARYYGASNAVLVLAGDIDPATARMKAAHYFSDVPKGRRQPQVKAPPMVRTRIRRDVIKDRVPNATLTRSWTIPSDDPRVLMLMQLVGTTLTDTPQAPLNELLVDKAKVAYGTAAQIEDQELTSSFSISVALRPGVDPKKVDALLDQALADYFAKGPSAAHVQAIRLDADVGLLRSLQSNEEIGLRLGHSYLLHEDPAFLLKQRQWVGEATPRTLRAVAEKWLKRPYYELVVLPDPDAAPITGEDSGPIERAVRPHGENPDAAKATIASAAPAAAQPTGTVDRSHPPGVTRTDGTIDFPKISQTTLPNGLHIVVAERHRLPIVDAVMRFYTGSEADTHYAPGAASDAFDLLTAGTTSRDAAAIERDLGAIGMSLGGLVGTSESAFSWNALASRLPQSFALAADLLRNPVYPQVRIDAANADARGAADDVSPQDAAPTLLYKALWGKDPAGGADADAVQSISRDAVRRFHDHEIGPNDATLFLLGDVTLDQARALAERDFGSWQRVSPAPEEDMKAPAQAGHGRVILVDAPGAAQTLIEVGELVPPFDRADTAVESLMEDILASGFDSRLNTQLRGQRGWSYGFSGSIANKPTGKREFIAGGSVEADHSADSMKLIDAIITGFVTDDPPTAQELEQNRAAAIQTVPSKFATSNAYLESMMAAGRYGLPYDHAGGAAKRLAAVTLPQIRTLAKRTFDPAKLTWVVVGDLSKIESGIRALDLGPVEVWTAKGKPVR